MKDFSNDIYCYYLLRISVMVISKSHWTQLNLSTRLSFHAGAKSQSWPDQILNVLLITAVTPSQYSLIIHSGRLYDSVKTEFSSSPVTVLLAPNHCSQVSFLFPRPWSHWSPQQCYFSDFIIELALKCIQIETMLMILDQVDAKQNKDLDWKLANIRLAAQSLELNSNLLMEE